MVTEMEKLYCCNEIAKVAGLKGGRMVSEFAFKHFGKENVYFDTAGHGGQQKKLYKITEDQMNFFLLRSRADAQKVADHFGLELSDVCLMRNEILFTSIIKGLLQITDIKCKTQHKLHIGDSYILVDLFIYGDFGCAVIEYDERQHKRNERKDKERDKMVVDHLMNTKGFKKVKVIRVKDNSSDFALSVAKINKLIHSDFFHPVEYNFD